MKRKSKLYTLVVGLALLLSASYIAWAGPDKVLVCHVTSKAHPDGGCVNIVMEVPAFALAGHTGHGDPVPGDGFTGQPGDRVKGPCR